MRLRLLFTSALFLFMQIATMHAQETVEIGTDSKDDRDCLSRCLSSYRSWSGRSDRYNGHVIVNQIRGQFRQPIIMVLRPPVFDRYVTTFREPLVHAQFMANSRLLPRAATRWMLSPVPTHAAIKEPPPDALRVTLLIGVMVYGAYFTSAQSQPFNEKNRRIQIVSEFVRELEVLYRLQETAKKEFAEDESSSSPSQAKIMTSIRVGSRTLLEMNDSIRRLDAIPVDGEWANIKDLLKQADTNRIEMVEELNQMGKAMLSDPKPGIDYGAMAAHAPELTAEVEQLDKSVFQMSQIMFYALLDERRLGPDGKLYHLLLTKKDRDDMIQLIDNAFGPSLEDKNATHIVNAAWAIKYGLTRPNYKSADEP